MKTLQKTIAIVAFATLLFSTNLFAQSATAPVSLRISKALAISNIGGSLVFLPVLESGSGSTETITQANGANFRVTGHPNRAVTITYADVTLTNNQWNTDNSMPAGNNASMTFEADMNHTGSSSTWAAGTSVSTGGDTHNLVNVTGTGTLYLWVGGDVDVAAGQNIGDYVGTLTVSVAY